MPPVVASLVAADLIRQAREMHPAFAEPRRHPDPVLVRALSRYQRRLIGKLLKAKSDSLVTTLEQALPLADFAAGIVVPDIKYPSHCEVQTASSPAHWVPIGLVGWQAQSRYALAVYLKNNVLYLSGGESDWLGLLALRFSYVPEANALTSPASVLVVPNASESCLVSYLGSFMAQRSQKDPDVEAPDKRQFKADWLGDEGDLLDELGRHTQAQVSQVREVF